MPCLRAVSKYERIVQNAWAPVSVAEAAADFLFHLWHADRPLGQVVRKRHAGLVHEQQHLALSLLESPQQVVGLALFDSAFLALRLDLLRVLLKPLRQA
jgi:hypothetical protein